MSEGRPTCKRCLCPMREGVALQNRELFSDDFLGTTVSRTGPADLVDVWKCPACGYSFTKDPPVEVKEDQIEVSPVAAM